MIDNIYYMDIDTIITEANAFCRPAIQKYLAYLQDMRPQDLFDDYTGIINTIHFKSDTLYKLKFDLVDDMYYNFDFNICPGRIVHDSMVKIINNSVIVCNMLLQEISSKVIPHPELFLNSKLTFTPFTSAFLYNKECGRQLHDVYTKRLAFVWV